MPEPWHKNPWGQPGLRRRAALKIVHPLKSEEYQNRYLWKITPYLNAMSKTPQNSFVE
jgi:hypothetical protein